MGVFGHTPFRRSADRRVSRRTRSPLQQLINREFSPIPPFSAKNRLENNCESSSLPDDPPEIPCVAEQGINSTTTGNEFATNRELIRHNRESGQSPDAPDSRQIPSLSRIKNRPSRRLNSSRIR